MLCDYVSCRFQNLGLTFNTLNNCSIIRETNHDAVNIDQTVKTNTAYI